MIYGVFISNGMMSVMKGKNLQMNRKSILYIILAIFTILALSTMLFVKNRLFDGKMTCRGVITNHIGDWEYDSDCIIIIESKYNSPWIVYESLEELNSRFNEKLEYGDHVWVSYTTDGYEIAPQLMEVVYIKEIRK